MTFLLTASFSDADSGALVIDTPGMRELALRNSREGISAAFVESHPDYLREKRESHKSLAKFSTAKKKDAGRLTGSSAFATISLLFFILQARREFL